MSSEVERLANLKKKLEEERKKLLNRVDEITLMLQLIDASLTQQSFVSAEELAKKEMPKKEEKPIITPKRSIGLLSFKGKMVLKAEVSPETADISIAPEARVPVESGPIRYLIKLFDRYVREDLEMIRKGSLNSDKKFTYIIDEKDGNLTRITLLNYNSNERLRDIFGKVKWAVRTLLKEFESRTTH